MSARMKPWMDHRWVANPSTRTERRWALNMREPKQNVVMFNPRYQNIDTGKFDTDKLPTIAHYCLSDIVVPETEWYHGTTDRPRRTYRKKVNVDKWFVPPDDDFDAECERQRQEEIDKQLAQVQERLKQLKAEEERIKAQQDLRRRIAHQQQHSSSSVCRIITSKWGR